MTHEVKLTDRAERNFEQIRGWYAAQSSSAADRWHNAAANALQSLEEHPERCTWAQENGRFPIELRQLNFGSGRKTTHRIVFAIRPNNLVVVYAIRHVAQQDLDPGDV